MTNIDICDKCNRTGKVNLFSIAELLQGYSSQAAINYGSTIETTTQYSLTAMHRVNVCTKCTGLLRVKYAALSLLYIVSAYMFVAVLFDLPLGVVLKSHVDSISQNLPETFRYVLNALFIAWGLGVICLVFCPIVLISFVFNNSEVGYRAAKRIVVRNLKRSGVEKVESGGAGSTKVCSEKEYGRLVNQRYPT